MRLTKIIILFIFFLSLLKATAQDTARSQITKPLFDSSSNVTLKDSTPVIAAKKDSATVKKKHDPHKATLRSAIVPGWGQAYNREYWKIPIVYGALAIPVATYVYNNKWYAKTKFAYQALYDATIPLVKDSSRLPRIDEKLKTSDTTFLSLETLQHYRNQFRKDKDYSILWFLILWGVNVLDATVFGHLKNFDVSDDLSVQVKPVYNPVINKPGISLVFNFKTPSHKLLLPGN